MVLQLTFQTRIKQEEKPVMSGILLIFWSHLGLPIVRFQDHTQDTLLSVGLLWTSDLPTRKPPSDNTQQ